MSYEPDDTLQCAERVYLTPDINNAEAWKHQMESTGANVIVGWTTDDEAWLCIARWASVL